MVREIRGDGVVIGSAVGELFAAPVPAGVLIGAAVEVGFRPESVRIGPSKHNAWSAMTESVTYLGETEQSLFRLPDGTQIKAFEQDPAEVRGVGTGAEVHVPPSSLFVLPAK